MLQDFIVGLGRGLNQDDPFFKYVIPVLVSIGSICIGLIITITNKIYQGVSFYWKIHENFRSLLN